MRNVLFSMRVTVTRRPRGWKFLLQKPRTSDNDGEIFLVASAPHKARLDAKDLIFDADLFLLAPGPESLAPLAVPSPANLYVNGTVRLSILNLTSLSVSALTFPNSPSLLPATTN